MKLTIEQLKDMNKIKEEQTGKKTFGNYNEANVFSMAVSPSNQEESNNYANALAQGNYPVGLDGCFTVGISGGCGRDCFVFQDGDCEEFFEVVDGHSITDVELIELYHDGLYESEIEQLAKEREEK